jgi:hypothetical protein
VEHNPLRPKKQFSFLPPTVPSAAPTTSDESRPPRVGQDFSSYSRVCSLFAKATNKKTMDVSRERQEVLLENQQNLHQKMQVEQPFVEFHPIEAPSELSNLFASLIAAEMVYLGMDAPNTLSTSTTVSDSDKESGNGDDANEDE